MLKGVVCVCVWGGGGGGREKVINKKKKKTHGTKSFTEQVFSDVCETPPFLLP